MRRWVFRILAILVVVSVVAFGLLHWLLGRQGAPLAGVERVGVSAEPLDGFGVPVIRGGDWAAIVEAQGFVVASERLFQMDLIRRFAGGRLSELFGRAALDADLRRHREDWSGVAGRAVEELPADERELCEAYAAGVNRFITRAEGHWSIEYALLRIEPEPWRCADTMLVLLSMIEQLTGAGEADAVRGAWKQALGERWFDFLFTQHHPWNEPIIGTTTRTVVLPLDRPLPAEPLGADEGHAAKNSTARETFAGVPEPFASQLALLAGGGTDVPGSNSWAWCGTTGCYLANDPHLGYSVPQTWFALRLERSPEEWAVGVSLPGIPGIVLGMNRHLAWAFTNVGEDVDDLLLERLSENGASYLADVEDGREVWVPVRTVSSIIRVKDAEPVTVEAHFTHRGPIEDRPHTGPSSRQWLAFQPGMLRLPSKLARAKDWTELNAALDDMKAPAQNVLMVDRAGNLGYRASGTGVKRRLDGQVPQPAIAGEWAGFEPPGARPRRFLAASSTATTPRFIATANQRIWPSPFGHAWADDARHERIRRALAASDRFGPGDMQALQLDTESRFHRWLLDWVAARAKPESEEQRRLLETWRRFDGVATKDRATFTRALAVEDAAQKLLIDRVRKHRLAPRDADLPYRHRLWRAWLLTTLDTRDGTEVFGVDEAAFAQRLLEIAEKTRVEPDYAEQNAWLAQHPFAQRVPLIGPLFEISRMPQVGSAQVPRVEGPKFGASVRVVWSLSRPEDSRWSFPVGQSGHIGSPHYDDARAGWFAERWRPVFPAR